jgi:hypothetical protein
MDPGRKNFAWALRKGSQVQKVGWIKPIVNVTNDAEFVNDCIELLSRYKPDFVVLERFMIRGSGGQSMIAETLNQMIGRLVILTRMFAGVELIQVTPAQWKNWWTKGKGADWHADYALIESIHQRDAAAISEYLEDHWITKNL